MNAIKEYNKENSDSDYEKISNCKLIKKNVVN